MKEIVSRLQKRARIYEKIRAFFNALNVLEVDTPLLGISTNTDCHIQSIEARVNGQKGYLQTSPEFAMKRLLAEGSGSIYQICHAFRDEELGRMHHAEFSLLEWYSQGFDYQQLMDQMESLLRELSDHDGKIPRFSYFELFEQYLGLNLEQATSSELQRCVQERINGIDSSQLSRDDCLDLLISQVIAANFSGFTFVYDYPSSQASLARIKPDNPHVAERFELFYNELELANGFTELTNASEQRTRFEQDNVKRIQMGLDPYPIDEAFLQGLEQGMPECSGVALGLDRLIMVLEQYSDINQALTLNTLK